MPPSTFASAASGSASTNAAHNDTGTEWSCRRTGSPHMFRRSSHAPNNTPSTQPSPGVYVPPHRNGSATARYPKDSLLDLFRIDPQESGGVLQELRVSRWDPQSVNGIPGTRHDNGKENIYGAYVCWDQGGTMQPLGIREMTEEEKEQFASSVNSPLKPSIQVTNKDPIAWDGVDRKSSLSHVNGTLASGSSRPHNTSDSSPFSSTAAMPPPLPLTRRLDPKDPNPESATSQESGGKDTAPTDVGIPPSRFKNTLPPQGTGFSAMGRFGNFTAPTSAGKDWVPAEKGPLSAIAHGESLLKAMIEGSSTEHVPNTPSEMPSVGRLGGRPDDDAGRQPAPWTNGHLTNPLNATRPLDAALATPRRQDPSSRKDDEFSIFGMTTDNTGFSSFLQGRDAAHQQDIHNHEPMSPTDTNPYQSPEHKKHEVEEIDTDGSDIQRNLLSGLGRFGNSHVTVPGVSTVHSSIGGAGRVCSTYDAAAAAASDRSQTSSVGPNRACPGLGGGIGAISGLSGLGASSVWPHTQPAVGTPSRENSNATFSDSIFDPLGDKDPSNLAGLGSGNNMNNMYRGTFGSALRGSGSMGRGSKLGSLFPSAMQDQMRYGEQNRFGDGGSDGDRLHAPFARSAFSTNAALEKDTQSPHLNGRIAFDDWLSSPNRDKPTQFGPIISSAQTPTAAGTQQPPPLGLYTAMPGQSQAAGVAASNQLPTPQQRTMVMPDRMRWVYRDPSGKAQGPWTGLEMHDWFKAGFFSPELLVKKDEDPDYEPLAQLIRRIGNSREPFLVPQIGIPHGPPSNQPGTSWSSSASAIGGAQPPFPNSFPSFGTTLTAEQQNALERRKQEEQYLMARQKEHLAQQQALVKQHHQQQQMGMRPHQLHHHSSAHSLHSQPSFGSIVSPGGYQTSTSAQATLPGMREGFFDNTFHPGLSANLSSTGAAAENPLQAREDISVPERLNLGRPGQLPFSAAPGHFGSQQHDQPHAQQVANMLNDRARLQREQSDYDARAPEPSRQMAERLKQFTSLQGMRGEEHVVTAAVPSPPAATTAATAIADTTASTDENAGIYRRHKDQEAFEEKRCEELSLPAHATAITTEGAEGRAQSPDQPSLIDQVKTASATVQIATPQSPWARGESSSSMFFPHSASPLPAPAARRMQDIPDTFHKEALSRPQTPLVDTPSASVAPWAKEMAEAPKGPSLKEIQEAEAKKRVEADAEAQAARAEAQRKGLLALAQQARPQPSLPASATWASSASPVNAPGTPCAWTKATNANKTHVAVGMPKKSLQQIQKEEEARKQATAASAATTTATATVSQSTGGGRRYADLASKQSPNGSNTPNGGAAWTTVGANGKTKIPAPAAAPPARTTDTGNVTSARTKPAAPTSAAAQDDAVKEAFRRLKSWVGDMIKDDLIANTDADTFVEFMKGFPKDKGDMIEAIRGISRNDDAHKPSTNDARISAFVDLFIKRLKDAEKGKFMTDDSGPSGGSGGWNEVVRRGSVLTSARVSTVKEDPPFKSIATKKKGGRKQA